MNWHIVEGSWKQVKGKTRTRWGWLIANRRLMTAGRRIELAGRMQKAFGVEMEQAEQRFKGAAAPDPNPRP